MASGTASPCGWEERQGGCSALIQSNPEVTHPNDQGWRFLSHYSIRPETGLKRIVTICFCHATLEFQGFHALKPLGGFPMEADNLGDAMPARVTQAGLVV